MPPTERWPGSADDSGGCGFLGELLFDGFVATGYAEDYVHFASARFLYRAGHSSRSVFDGVVEELGFGFVALCRWR